MNITELFEKEVATQAVLNQLHVSIQEKLDRVKYKMQSLGIFTYAGDHHYHYDGSKMENNSIIVSYVTYSYGDTDYATESFPIALIDNPTDKAIIAWDNERKAAKAKAKADEDEKYRQEKLAEAQRIIEQYGDKK